MSATDGDAGKVEKKTPGQIILGWWAKNLNREDWRSRALAARLRRAGPVEALADPEVHDLARELGLGKGSAVRLARLVSLLAEVRDHSSQTLARRLGGAEPLMSKERFERLMRADDDELRDALRRAIIAAERKCNVAALGADLLHWSEDTRSGWYFHYFGGDAPRDESKETME